MIKTEHFLEPCNNTSLAPNAATFSLWIPAFAGMTEGGGGEKAKYEYQLQELIKAQTAKADLYKIKAGFL